ncbi:hypothetical protein [Pseudonocardia humida]|uniref:Uncharacterized protein n=1 Tax=Pseudonocardia humida TaxID=2800819 RepID=A0ABT1A1G8_9PSEU|nr:hypothetical protein [Pseudonocardia humida]MCO1656846.1 hypothetical protein [Pseudonocardia humida]
MDERELAGLRDRVHSLRRDAWAMVEDDELYDPEGALPMAERAGAALRTMERALAALPEPHGVPREAARWLRWERAETSYHVADLIERWSPDVPHAHERALAAATAAFEVFRGWDLRAATHALRLMSVMAARVGRAREAVGWVLEFRGTVPADVAPRWFLPTCERMLRDLRDEHLVDSPAV